MSMILWKKKSWLYLGKTSAKYPQIRVFLIFPKKKKKNHFSHFFWSRMKDLVANGFLVQTQYLAKFLLLSNQDFFHVVSHQWKLKILWKSMTRHAQKGWSDCLEFSRTVTHGWELLLTVSFLLNFIRHV